MNHIHWHQMTREQKNQYQRERRKRVGYKATNTKYNNTPATPLSPEDKARLRRTADEMLRRVDEIVRGGE